MLEFDVVYQIRFDWSQSVRCQAASASMAAAVSKQKLEDEHGKIASRWGVIKSIEPVLAEIE